MNWNKFDEVVPPEKDRLCWVYKPNNRFCKFAVDEWVDFRDDVFLLDKQKKVYQKYYSRKMVLLRSNTKQLQSLVIILIK